MPREFTAEPCIEQRDILDCLGFKLVPTSRTAGSCTWHGHGIQFEIREKTPLTFYSAAELIIDTTRASERKDIRKAVGL